MDNGLLCEAYGATWQNTERWKLEREQRKYKKMLLAWAGWGGGVGSPRAKEMGKGGAQTSEAFVCKAEKQINAWLSASQKTLPIY